MKLFTIPNILTLGNLFFGCLSIFSFFSLKLTDSEHIKLLLIFTFFSLALDFLDGFMARLLNSNSEIGKELDSLADLISFGLVPALIMYKVLKQVLLGVELNELSSLLVLTTPILITLFSALRLAKFNVDNSQNTYFKGLATPANTILILSIGLVYFLQKNSFLFPIFNNLFFLIFLILISSLLLISNIPMFSFKLSVKELKRTYYLQVFFLISILSLFFLKFIGLFVIMIVYVLISILFKNKITELK